MKSLTMVQPMTYFWSAIFVAGNILLPMLCHNFGLSGQVWLPIMFFTLIGTLFYGATVGVLTSIVSPALSFALMGMPSVTIAYILTAKSVVLALTLVSFRREWYSILFAILAYQLAGFLLSWMLIDMSGALAMIRISYPGMIVQVVAALICIISRR